MLVFSVFGAVFGMSEETIAFIIILVPLSISMGYDSIVGVSMSFVAAGLGFAGAVLNPFTIGIAQGIADLPLFSGFGYRLFSWFVINLVGITWILRYAAKIRKNPKLSPVYNTDVIGVTEVQLKNEEIVYTTPRIAWYVYILFNMSRNFFMDISSYRNENWEFYKHFSRSSCFNSTFYYSGNYQS